jgi:hypothetical protein
MGFRRLVVRRWALQQNGGVEYTREMRRAHFVRGRDGDYGTWLANLKAQGYTVVAFDFDERDPSDGSYGRAHEIQGPLKATESR